MHRKTDRKIYYVLEKRISARNVSQSRDYFNLGILGNRKDKI
jgi:hypothetical protein